MAIGQIETKGDWRIPVAQEMYERERNPSHDGREIHREREREKRNSGRQKGRGEKEEGGEEEEGDWKQERNKERKEEGGRNRAREKIRRVDKFPSPLREEERRCKRGRRERA